MSESNLAFLRNTAGFLSFVGILADLYYLYQIKVLYMDQILASSYQGLEIYIDSFYYQLTVIGFVPWMVIHIPLNVVLFVTTQDSTDTPSNWPCNRCLLIFFECVSGLQLYALAMGDLFYAGFYLVQTFSTMWPNIIAGFVYTLILVAVNDGPAIMLIVYLG